MYRQLLVVCLFLAIAADLLEGKKSFHKRSPHHRSLSHHKQRQLPACENHEFLCVNQSRCVPRSYFCDGDNDCGDFSDEPNDCLTRPCEKGEVKCANGRCVDANSYCSGSEGMRCGITITPGFECPRPECDPNQFACARLTKCINRPWVCDTDNDCLDNSDEHNCGNNQCHLGEIRCNNGQCIDKAAHCNYNSWGGCRDSTELTRACLDFPCAADTFKCQSTGRCIGNYSRCDGYDNCEDGSDEDGCPPVQCGDGYEKCPIRNKCINERYFCDDDNDCGDNSDEAEALCKHRNCGPGFFTCPSGQCLPMESFCRSGYSCRVNSPSPSEIPACREFIVDPPGPVPPANDDLSGYMFQFQCMVAIRENCSDPAFVHDFGGQSPQDIVSKLTETDLRQICSPLQEWTACALEAYASTHDCQRAEELLPEMRMQQALYTRTLSFVCNEHIDVFNRNKACLLKLDDHNEPVLGNRIMETCLRPDFGSHGPDHGPGGPDHGPGGPHGEMPPPPPPPPHGNPICFLPRSIIQCAKNVIATDCTDEIAEVFDQYVDIAMEHMCPTPTEAAARAMKRHSREVALLKKMFGSFF